MEVLKEHKVELIVLAGYMRFIGKVLLDNYPRRIINLHPAYLPSFPGAHSIQDAYEAKVDFTGVTVHFVDEGVDTGEINYPSGKNKHRPVMVFGYTGGACTCDGV